MSYNIGIIMCSVLFLIVDLEVLLTSNKHKDGSSNPKTFQFFTLFVTLQQAFAVLILIAEAGIWKVPSALHYLFYFGALCCMSLSALFWFLYLRALVTDYQGLSLIQKVLLSFPIIILTITCLASPITHWVYYIDADGVYRRGSLVFLQIAVPYFYPILAIILCAITLKKVKIERTLKLVRFFILFVAPSLLCVLIQMFFVPGGFSAIGISMGLILMYLNLYVDDASKGTDCT